MLDKHASLERKAISFTVWVTIVVAIGGLIEMVPLFTMKQGGQPSTAEAEAAVLVKPRTGLVQEGFDIYVREGCYNCHSQMIRPFRHETERYGPYSLAAEAQYDRPFQYGSRRMGPDIARVGGKYPDAWHVQHMKDPASMVPGSVMPRYPWLAETKLGPDRVADIQNKLRVQRMLGVPVPDSDIEGVSAEVLNKTELDAMIAYLQSLGVAAREVAAKESARVR